MPFGRFFGLANPPLTGTMGAKIGHGTRPLANTQQVGQVFIATDLRYKGIVIPHPHSPGDKIWYPVVTERQIVSSVIAGNAVTARRFGVYDLATNKFTQAIAVGQACNANCSGAAAQDAVIGGCNVVPGLLSVPTLAAYGAVTGDEIMTDASGFAVLYVNNGTNVPLGWITFNTNAGVSSQIPIILYDP